MSHIEVDLKNVDIPRLLDLKKEISNASNSNYDQSIVSLDQGKVIAIRLREPGLLHLRKIWDAHVMAGVLQYRDFTIPATRDFDADMDALVTELARQRLTPEDIARALHAATTDNVETFDVTGDDPKAGRPVTYVRVDTRPEGAEPHA